MARYAIVLSLAAVMLAPRLRAQAANAQQTQSSGIIGALSEVCEFTLINRVAPLYPRKALEKGIEGDVTLRAQVFGNGQVGRIEVLSGDRHLSDDAIKAVEKWTYKPCIWDGRGWAHERLIALKFSAPGSVVITSDTATVESAGRAIISQKLADTMRLKSVPPSYPPLAQMARIQGLIVLRIVVDQRGRVSKVALVSGHPMLAEAAAEAVKRWRYRPYEKAGQPAEFETYVSVQVGP